MTKKEVKKVNFDVYNSKTKELIKKFDTLWARIFDIDNAFLLRWWEKDKLKILEIWCFSWREFEYIKNYSKKYTWIDISKDAIDYAKNKFQDWEFIIWDIEEYEFDKKFDIIFAFASLIHSDIETTKKLFEKFYKILNENWIIYISMKSSENYSEITKTDEFWTRIYYHYSLEEYKKLPWGKFEVIYQDEQNFNNQNWFTIGFRKILKK